MTDEKTYHLSKKGWLTIKIIHITKKCHLCRKKLEKPVLAYNKKNDIVLISGEFAFHLSDTHGISPGEFLSTLSRL